MIGYKRTDKHQPHGFGFDIRSQPKEVMIIAPVKRRKKEYKEAKAKREKEKGLIDMNSLLDRDRK